MPKVILYRLLQFPLILAVIYLLTFLLARVAPGDPFVNERNLDPLVTERLKKKYPAESPAKFLAWFPWTMITAGVFVPSMQYREWSVNDIVKASLPVTIT